MVHSQRRWKNGLRLVVQRVVKARSAPAATVFVACLAACVLAVWTPVPAHAGDTCETWASTGGVDAAGRGSEMQPGRSVAHLISLLGPGETGCLLSGQTFNEPLGTFIVNSSAGTQARPVTVRSSDAQDPAQINAAVLLNEGADNIVFRDLGFVGAPAPDKSNMIVIDGADGIEFRHDDISWTHGICVSVGKMNPYVQPGAQTPQRSDRFVFDGNRLHDCGAAVSLTNQDSGVHGLYVQYTLDAQITNNFIYDNINRGIQLYPDSEGSVIAHNVLDGNGSNIHISTESSFGHLSHDNVIRDNLISNADLKALTNPNWPEGDSDQIFGYGYGGAERGPNDEPTFGNAVEDNCMFQPGATHNFGGWGYAQTGNLFVDPLYLDRAQHDYSLQPASPCLDKGPGVGLPDTFITGGPSGRTHDRTPTLSFESDPLGAEFDCKLDVHGWNSCVSSKSYRRQAYGQHVFRVRALSEQSEMDPTPARSSFRIVR